MISMESGVSSLGFFRRRIIRPLVSRLANLCPKSVFYSKDYVEQLLQRKIIGTHQDLANKACIALAVASSEILDPGDSLKFSFTGVANKGADVGDFIVTIERLR